MGDITINYHGGNARSNEANESIKVTKEELQIVVLRAIGQAGELGLTSDEAEVRLGLRHQTCSARFTELKALGLIEVCGRRKTRSGRNADAWRVKVRL